MNLYELGNGVYRYYTTYVKGNKNLDQLQVQKKLTRNILLTKKKIFTNRGEIYYYGNLMIVVRGNKIVHIKNIPNRTANFQVNRKKFKELNRILEIDRG